VVVGAVNELANGMNVAASTDYSAIQHQQFVNLMTLLDYDEDFSPRPYLAESWEVAPDGSAITFHLRQDVRWHDGEPTDAHDVAFTYRVLTDPRTGFPNVAFWDGYVAGEEGVEVLDDFTVRVRLEPHADFLDPWRAVAVLPEHLLGDVEPQALAGHPFGSLCPVGNGPFVFREHREQDRWVFEANPGFPAELGGRPFLDTYVYRVVPEASTLLLELVAGSVDVYLAAQPDQARQILDREDLELRSYPFRNVTFAAWNSRRPQFADSRVRRALTTALDREEIVGALLRGYGRVANGTVPPYHWAFDPDKAPLPFDRDAAAELLRAAGWADRDGDGIREDVDGHPLAFTLKYNQGNDRLRRLATVVQAQLREVGVDVRPVVLEWATLVSQITNVETRDFDGVLLSWVTEFKLDDTDLFSSERVDQPYGWSGTSNPTLDSLLHRLSSSLDRAEARILWGEYQAVLAAEQPYSFFYFPDRLDGVNRKVRGVHMDVRGEWVNLKDWWIDPDLR
jgi:peptide/nickel transport system substrate-binding protein